MNRTEHLENIARIYFDYVSGDTRCRFDHDGYCQHHGWYDDGPCIAEYIKEVLDMGPENGSPEEESPIEGFTVVPPRQPLERRPVCPSCGKYLDKHGPVCEYESI